MENKQQKPALTLITVLAHGSTDESRKLLKKYGINDPKDHAELETKLASLYAKYPNKAEIEKEFVNIHPHKDFILKYSAPLATSTVDNTLDDSENSNCDGCQGKCNTSNACGCSNAEGSNKKEIQSSTPANPRNDTHIILGIIGIVGVVGLFMHYNK